MANRDVDMVDDAAARVPDPNDGNAHLLQTNHSDAFAFSETEELALQLYDQLQELELQQSLIQAQQAGMFHPGSFTAKKNNNNIAEINCECSLCA